MVDKVKNKTTVIYTLKETHLRNIHCKLTEIITKTPQQNSLDNPNSPLQPIK